jgi:hypothetical protein
VKLQRNGFDFIFLDRIYRIDGIFSPSARSPFGRRPFYPDDPVDPVQFSFKDENPFLFLPYFNLRFFTFLFRLDWPLFRSAAALVSVTIINESPAGVSGFNKISAILTKCLHFRKRGGGIKIKKDGR